MYHPSFVPAKAGPRSPFPNWASPSRDETPILGEFLFYPLITPLQFTAPQLHLKGSISLSNNLA